LFTKEDKVKPKRAGKYLAKQGAGLVNESNYGIYVVQSAGLVDSDGYFSVGTSFCVPGKAHETHSHPDHDEIIYFMNGIGIQKIGDDEAYEVHEGDMAFMPAGMPHSLECTCQQPLRMIVIKVNSKNRK
jgi:mannose-6-phosphate isomerase-like protein (cupin superfamily)